MLPARCQVWAQRECHREQVPHGEVLHGEAWLAGQEDSVINTVRDVRGPISAAPVASVCPRTVTLQRHSCGAESLSGWHMCGLKLFVTQYKKTGGLFCGVLILWGLGLRVSDF